MDLEINKEKGEQSIRGEKYPDWYSLLRYYRKSDNKKAVLQLADTLLPYFCLWILMILSIRFNFPYYYTLLLVVPASAFLVRIFILFHDCVHGSFMTFSKGNKIAGSILGVLVFTSFDDWRISHLKHHAKFGNLDERGYGDIWTLTLSEYNSLTVKKKIKYRLYRSPVVFVMLGGFYTFFLGNRFPDNSVKFKDRKGVLYTDLIILLIIIFSAFFIGLKTYLLIQIPVLWLAGMSGIWLFYVQHQFEGVYWARKGEWDLFRASMEGCSFYKLPAVLRWFSGNIGYHHVHHLSPAIPNYFLKKCYDAVPPLQSVKSLSILKSLYCIRLKIWDEKKNELSAF